MNMGLTWYSFFFFLKSSTFVLRSFLKAVSIRHVTSSKYVHNFTTLILSQELLFSQHGPANVRFVQIVIMVCFQKVTVYWTSPKSCLRYQMILWELPTALSVNVSWHLVQGPDPARTCNPAQSYGAQARPGGSWCARLATFPGLMVQAVATTRSVTGLLALIGAPPWNPRWEHGLKLWGNQDLDNEILNSYRTANVILCPLHL